MVSDSELALVRPASDVDGRVAGLVKKGAALRELDKKIRGSASSSTGLRASSGAERGMVATFRATPRACGSPRMTVKRRCVPSSIYFGPASSTSMPPAS